MFEDHKIKKSIIITLGLLSLFLAAKFVAEVKAFRFIGSNLQGQSAISVSGRGEIVAVPDVATFMVRVMAESLMTKEAKDEAAKKINEILSFLRKNGVAEKDIKTSSYRISPRYDFTPCLPGFCPPQPYSQGKQTIVAYVVSQTLSVKLRDVDSAGKILGGIGEMGATKMTKSPLYAEERDAVIKDALDNAIEVSELTLDVDKREELAREARDKAIADARSEAAKLVKALGVRLVRIISYSEGGGYPIYYAKAEAAFGRGGDIASIAPEIPVGEDKIVSNVSITYEVK